MTRVTLALLVLDAVLGFYLYVLAMAIIERVLPALRVLA